MDMKTMFCFTFHLLSPFNLCHLIDCWLMVNSIKRISTGIVFSVVQYCLGYFEGEAAHILMISPQVHRLSV